MTRTRTRGLVTLRLLSYITADLVALGTLAGGLPCGTRLPSPGPCPTYIESREGNLNKGDTDTECYSWIEGLLCCEESKKDLGGFSCRISSLQSIRIRSLSRRRMTRRPVPPFPRGINEKNRLMLPVQHHSPPTMKQVLSRLLHSSVIN